MKELCSDPLVQSIVDHPFIRKQIEPLVHELEALEAKGINKTADDRLRIQAIRSDISIFIRRTLVETIIVDLGLDGTHFGQLRVEDIDREKMVKLQNVHTDGRNFATADASMFTTPWSREFVHGADSALHIGDLASKILSPAERLTGIDRITWRKPVTTNLQLAVYARAFDKTMDMSPYSVDGELHTSEGRRLTFLGMAIPDTEIDLHMSESNPFAQLAICPCPNCKTQRGELATYRVHDLHPSMKAVLDKDESLKMSTLLEMLTMGVAHSQMASDPRDKRNLLKLLAGVNGLVLPQTWDELRDGKLYVELHHDAAKIGRSGMTLIPFEYRFPHMRKTESGLVAATESITCAEKVLDGCKPKGQKPSHRR